MLSAPDYVVVGAGIHGAGLAWELARRGARVLVLEAAGVASGASGGLGERGVRSNGRDVRQLPLMKMAQKRWRHLARVLGDRRIFRRVGHLHLVESEADLAAAEERVRRQEAHGVRTRLVTGADLRRLEPDLGADVLAAMHAPDDGVSNHTVTTRALMRAARRHGARLVRGVRVVRLEVAADRVVAVATARGTRVPVEGGVVLAANAGSAELMLPLGIRLPLVNVLPQVLVTKPVRSVTVRHVIGHVRRRLAVKALAGGRIMVTGGWLGRVDAATGRGETVESEVAGNLDEAIAVYPRLAGVRLGRAVADRFESVAPDLLPIIDRVPGAVNLLVATAWSGNGWGPAPAVVSLLAEWLLEGRKPELLEPFGLDRFC